MICQAAGRCPGRHRLRLVGRGMPRERPATSRARAVALDHVDPGVAGRADHGASCRTGLRRAAMAGICSLRVPCDLVTPVSLRWHRCDAARGQAEQVDVAGGELAHAVSGQRAGRQVDGALTAGSEPAAQIARAPRRDARPVVARRLCSSSLPASSDREGSGAAQWSIGSDSSGELGPLRAQADMRTRAAAAADGLGRVVQRSVELRIVASRSGSDGDVWQRTCCRCGDAVRAQAPARACRQHDGGMERAGRVTSSTRSTEVVQFLLPEPVSLRHPGQDRAGANDAPTPP